MKTGQDCVEMGQQKLWEKRMREGSRYWIHANYNNIYFEILHNEIFCVSTKKIKIYFIVCILSINITLE